LIKFYKFYKVNFVYFLNHYIYIMTKIQFIFIFCFCIYLEIDFKNMNQETFNKLFIMFLVFFNNFYVITKYSKTDNNIEIAQNTTTDDD